MVYICYNLPGRHEKKMNTLQQLLKEAIDKRHLSMRAAAREIGVAHTTLIRILNGEKCDMPTLQKIAAWLGVTPSSLVDTLNTDDTTTIIAAVLSAEPELAKVFKEAAQRVIDGKMTPGELRDLVSYAAFRFGIGKENNAP
jgi:transcriptional regulator with XRE-family HTH domain